MHLLGCGWKGRYFVDRCLPIGCSSSCAYFEAFSWFLKGVVRDVSGCQLVIHYLDDFLCIGPGGGNVCSLLLYTVEWVAAKFGVPLVPGKTEGPATVIRFLGIVMDTVNMECRLLEEKLQALQEEVGQVANLKKVQLRVLQSLLGK